MKNWLISINPLSVFEATKTGLNRTVICGNCALVDTQLKVTRVFLFFTLNKLFVEFCSVVINVFIDFNFMAIIKKAVHFA